MMDHRQNSGSCTCRTNNTMNTSVMNNTASMINRTVATAAPAQKPCRKDLMDTINQCSFAMNEANLFLDTHPFDTEALAYFQKHREHRVEAMKEYAKYYAPLAIDYAVSDKTPWSWVNEPWPWEGVEY